MSFNIGETVGAYRVMEKLGQGGMASVFKAYHPALDRYVALKVMHRAFHADENFMARFQREARVVAKLDHPNIVPIYDFAEHQGNSYLVMKYIQGETLKARLKRRAISAEEGLAVIKAVGAALAYAHENGILHRDVKPSNVIMSEGGGIYLTDFGLARIAAMGESTLSSETMLGTPQYISPEQALGKKDLDAGTDIYSFGVLIYELVVGDVPFRADTPIAIVHDHIYTPLPLPREKNPNVPEEIERILLKALAKERADRFETINDLVAVFLGTVQPESPAEMSGASIRYTDETLASEKPSSGAGGLDTLDVIQEDKPKKPPNPWIKGAGIAAILIVMCLCVFIIFSDRNKPEPEANLPTEVQLELIERPDKTKEKEPELEERDPIELAKKKVDNNPDDPNAHLELAAVFLNHQMWEDAQQEFDAAFDLAEGDEEFYRRNGQQFLENGSYLLAYRLYFHFIENYELEGLPFWAKEGVQMTAYLGSGQEFAPEVIFSTFNPEDTPAFVGRFFFEVLELRHQFNLGNAEERVAAERRLNELLEIVPDYGPSRLLYGEVLLLQNDYDQAEEVFNALMLEENIPEWVKSLANYYLEYLIP